VSVDGYALAYSEARRGLEDQERLVAELRTRASVLIAAAAVATSFFGGRALTGQVIGAAAWVAIGCFVLIGFAVVLVLWPSRNWVFSIAPAELIGTYLEPVEGRPLELHAIHRDLALHMGRNAAANRRQLAILTLAFRVGTLLLVLELMAWILALLAHS
jgi:hypothetical protein